MTVSTVPTMIVHVLGRSGPLMHAGRPVTITVRSATSPHTPLPEGDAWVGEPWAAKRVRGAAAKRLLRRKRPGRDELEKLADRVIAWDGFLYRGAPIPCNRRLLLALLESPMLRMQLADALRDFDNSGIK